jgi:predicted nucleic acid-binding protein
VIVIDTSAWVEHQRETGSRADLVVRRLLLERGPIAVTEVIVMELLAGTPDPRTALNVSRFEVLRLRGLSDFERAAALFRACRTAGETVRSLIDCLIAVPTIRAGASIVHADRDFDVLARHSALNVLPV